MLAVTGGEDLALKCGGRFAQRLRKWIVTVASNQHSGMVTLALKIHMWVHTTTNNQHSDVEAFLHGSPQTVVTNI